MAIAERGKIITEEKEAIKKFKDQFEKILKTIYFKVDCSILSDLCDDSILNSIEKILQYASVLKIKQLRISSDLLYPNWFGLLNSYLSVISHISSISSRQD